MLDVAGAVPRGRETSLGMALVDAQLVAGMKRAVDRRRVVFELRPHASYSPGMLGPLEVAAARYAAFLGVEPVVSVRS